MSSEQYLRFQKAREATFCFTNFFREIGLVSRSRTVKAETTSTGNVSSTSSSKRKSLSIATLRVLKQFLSFLAIDRIGILVDVVRELRRAATLQPTDHTEGQSINFLLPPLSFGEVEQAISILEVFPPTSTKYLQQAKDGCHTEQPLSYKVKQEGGQSLDSLGQEDDKKGYSPSSLDRSNDVQVAIDTLSRVTKQKKKRKNTAMDDKLSQQSSLETPNTDPVFVALSLPPIATVNSSSNAQVAGTLEKMPSSSSSSSSTSNPPFTLSLTAFERAVAAANAACAAISDTSGHNKKIKSNDQ